MRVAARGPHHLVRLERGIDERPDRLRVAHRSHAADALAGARVDEFRIGAGCATGPTPPIAWPVHSRTERASARVTAAEPVRDATRDVSTRCAPLVITSSGAPSASNTRLLAIAPTSQPSCAAAVAAVGAGSGSSRT